MHPTQGRVHGVSLRELLPGSETVGVADIRVAACCSDAGSCRPGDLFVAIVGDDEDGHDMAEEAVRRGAVAVLAERFLPVSVPVCLVDDSREAYGRVCQAMAGRPSDRLAMVGVSGSYGKTTTGTLVASILKQAGLQVGTITGRRWEDGDGWQEPGTGDPTTAEWAHWLSRMEATGCTHAVTEFSSRSLAQRHTAGVGLDAAVMTNIRGEHLDLHGSVANYRRAKARLVEHLKPHGFLAWNADDPTSRAVLSQVQRPNISYAMHERAEIMASVLERHASEQTFLITAGSDAMPVRTRMIGDHHIYNCLAATAVGLVLGIDLPAVVRGLEYVESLPGRLERIECGQPFNVFVDGAKTPDSLAVALNTVRRVTRGRLLCVLGVDADLAPELRPMLGRIAERVAQMTLITGGGCGGKVPLSRVHDVLDGFDRPAKAHVLPGRQRAISWALSQAREGDSILITGRSPADVVLTPRGRKASTDADAVRRWLYQAAATEEGLPATLKIYSPEETR